MRCKLQCAMNNSCVSVVRLRCQETELTPTKKNMPLHATSPSTTPPRRPPNHPHAFHLSNHEPAQSAAPVSSLSCHLNARTCLLRKPCLRAQFFIRSSVPKQPSPLYTRPTNDASPSKRRCRDRQQQMRFWRNGRDSTVRAERSTLPQSPRKTITSRSLQQGGDLAVANMTRNRQCVESLHLSPLVGAGGEKPQHHVFVAAVAGNDERCLSPLLSPPAHHPRHSKVASARIRTARPGSRPPPPRLKLPWPPPPLAAARPAGAPPQRTPRQAAYRKR